MHPIHRKLRLLQRGSLPDKRGEKEKKLPASFSCENASPDQFGRDLITQTGRPLEGHPQSALSVREADGCRLDRSTPSTFLLAMAAGDARRFIVRFFSSCPAASKRFIKLLASSLDTMHLGNGLCYATAIRFESHDRRPHYLYPHAQTIGEKYASGCKIYCRAFACFCAHRRAVVVGNRRAVSQAGRSRTLFRAPGENS